MISSLSRALVMAVVIAGLSAQAVSAQPSKPRLSRLQGTASLDRRTDVVGAVVAVQPEGDSSRHYLTSTDGHGVFWVDGLPNGSYRVSVSRHGFEPVIKNGVELKFPFRAVVELTLARGSGDTVAPAAEVATPVVNGSTSAGIQGRLVDRDGLPVVEARIRFVHPSGRIDPHIVHSGDQGSFEIPDLTQGLWRFEAWAVGYLPLTADLDLRQDTEISLFLVPQPADYEQSPLELMPEEQPIPPAGF